MDAYYVPVGITVFVFLILMAISHWTVLRPISIFRRLGSCSGRIRGPYVEEYWNAIYFPLRKVQILDTKNSTF